jgi:hypothetical protein
MQNGEISISRGGSGDFKRGIHLEACYFIHAEADRVAKALLHWDPRKHPELDVHFYREFGFPPQLRDFEALSLENKIYHDQWLIDRTNTALRTGEASELHLTNKELTALPRDGDPSEIWRKILTHRSEAFASGGLAALPPYAGGDSISPATEFHGLLSLAPKAERYFQPILGARPLVASDLSAVEAVGYWEAAVVRDHTTLQLGSFAAVKVRDSWQLVDCLYYPSDTYFMALNLFQLWPVEGGTLVWQVGFASIPLRGYLGRIDRFVATRQMTEQTAATIKAFRADLER